VAGSGFDDLMEAHGGWNNAWTSEDNTDYYSVGPTNLLPTLLWMDADRIDGLGKAMTQEKLDLQRDVVRNERRQSYEDEPYGEAWLALNRAMYPEGHPYAHPVIGSHEDLEAATLQDVVGFFDTWYVPDNACLVVAGDFDPQAIKPQIDQWFGHLQPRDLPARPEVATPDLPVVPLTELTDQVQIPKTIMAWHTPASFQPGDADMDLVASVLSQGRSSRLYTRLVHDEQIALEVDASQFSQKLSSIFLIEALPSPGHTLEELETAITEELARLGKDGPTPAEMERVHNAVEVSFIRGLESLQARATALNHYRALVGEPGWANQDLARYRAADADSVRAAAARLTPERRAVIRVRPATEPAAEPAAEGQK